MKLVLHSDDSFVAFGQSGSAITGTDTLRLFPLVQSASISVDVAGARQKSKFLGRQRLGINDIIKQPEVAVDINYYLSPYGPNETLCGLTGSNTGETFSALDALKTRNNNIYFAFNNKEPQEGFSEPRSQTDGNWDDYSFVGIGNCYLSKYAVSFSLNEPVKAAVSFVGDNMLAVEPTGDLIRIPSYNPADGTKSTGEISLNTLYSGLDSGLAVRPEGRTLYNPSVVLPYKCDVSLSDLQCGGINLTTGANPVIQSMALSVDFDRTPHYNLGSNYPCTRKASWPLNGSLDIDFLVSGLKTGELEALVSNETGHSLRIDCTDFIDSSVTLSYSIPEAKLEASSYSCSVNDIYRCQMKFSFEDFGYGTNAAPPPEPPYDDTFDVYVGGIFSLDDSVSAPSIIGLKTLDADINTSFAYSSGFNGSVETIARQSDGKLIIGGDFTQYKGVSRNRIVRLNTDGSFDTGFNMGSGFDGIVRSIYVQTGDQKILVGGGFTSYNGTSQNRITRLNTNGTRDTGFAIGVGFGGSLGTSRGSGHVFGVCALTGGQIAVVGSFTSYSGVDNNTGCIVLNSGGTKYTTFVNAAGGYGGTASAAGYGFGVTPTHDGQFLLYGSCNGWINSVGNGKRLMKMNLNGTIQYELALGNAYSVANLRDGSNGFVVVGEMGIRKLTNTLTTGVSSYTVPTFAGGFPTTVFVRQNNDIIAGGSFTGCNGFLKNNLLRINTSGVLDQSFHVGSGFNGAVKSIVTDSSENDLYVGGSFSTYQKLDGDTIIKFKPDGTENTSFNAGQSGCNGLVYASARQSDGKIILGGDFTKYNGVSVNRIVRISTDGTIDASFATNIGTGFNGAVRTIAIQAADQKIVVGGDFTSFNGTARGLAARLLTTGALDTAWNFSAGAGFGPDGSSVLSIKIYSTTRIFVCGSFTTFNGNTRNRLIALNQTTGAEDSGFAVSTTGANALVRDLVVQSDGKVIIGGDFTTWKSLTAQRCIRILTNGTRDTTFVITNIFSSPVHKLGLQSDEKLIAVGEFSSHGGNSCTRIARLTTTGTFDATFTSTSGFPTTPTALLILSDDKILVGGNFTTVHGTSTKGYAKLNSNGTVDSTSTVMNAGELGIINTFAA